MNRIIKFRAWDKQINQIHYWNSVDQKHDNIFWSMVKNNGMPITQFTGLKDKNGIEIYEGDIVNLEDYDTPYTVDYAGSSFVLTHVSHEAAIEYQLDKYSNFVTVIGNQYEHHHLLETQNK